jgi:hypothetical protein
VPALAVEAGWPKPLPNGWAVGLVRGMATDASIAHSNRLVLDARSESMGMTFTFSKATVCPTASAETPNVRPPARTGRVSPFQLSDSRFQILDFRF